MSVCLEPFFCDFDNYIHFLWQMPFFRILATTRAAFQSQELTRVKTRSLFMLSQVSEYSSRISVLLFWSYNLHDRPYTKWWFLGINPISRFITYGLFSNRAHTILNNLNKVVNRKLSAWSKKSSASIFSPNCFQT